MRPETLRRAVPHRGLFGSLGLALMLASTAGCGGGLGGGGGGSPAPLTIATTSLPPAGQNVPYSNALRANGGDGGYQWTLASGSTLPDGLGLGSDGTISGQATTLGSYSFSIVVTDKAAATDSASFALDVSPFAAQVTLLHWGDGWTGETYPLSSVGGGSTTFTIVQNGSGGSITGANPSLGTATFVAGSNAGTDVIRASSSGGQTQDLTVVVYRNPVAQMTGRFSSTDVWYCRFDGKLDTSHLYASDFDAAMASAGLRSSSSFDATGTTADQLARAYVRQQTLRYLNQMYGNAGDGSPVLGGVAASFPFDEPASPHFCPDDGTTENPRSNQYNVLSFISGTQSGVVGTAFLDSTSNDLQENNTTTSKAGELGVFADEIVYYFDSAYSNQVLTAVPVDTIDVPALKALLYGTANPGGRYVELKRIGEGLGRTFAAVAAHEIGHSLGLNHTAPPQTSSIMNAVATFGPTEQYSFIASDYSILVNDTPGPGRGGSPERVDTGGAFGGGTFGFEKVQCGACTTIQR